MKSWHNHSALLLRTTLFEGFTSAELDTVLHLLNPPVRHFGKGQALLMPGDETNEIGIVLSGVAEAAKVSRSGGQMMVQRLEAGRLYGDVLAVGTAKSPVEVRAVEPVAVMLIGGAQLFAPPAGQEALFLRLLGNLVRVLADKYFALDRRMDLLLVRGLRQRLAAYLLGAGKSATPGEAFTIPFTRAQLAVYLGCDRSALCRELSALVRLGLVETRRTTFRLLDAPKLESML